MLLLRVIGGSHLYGTAHADSDWDYVEVHDRIPGRRQSHQSIVDDIDTLYFGLTRFLILCETGFPRALEAMFAPDTATEVDVLRHYRHAFIANVATATATYMSVIERLGASGSEKHRQHAIRLTDNLDELQHRGRFDPVWRPETARFD